MVRPGWRKELRSEDQLVVVPAGEDEGVRLAPSLRGGKKGTSKAGGGMSAAGRRWR